VASLLPDLTSNLQFSPVRLIRRARKRAPALQ